MIKSFLYSIVIVFFVINIAQAYKITGWHWYNEPKEEIELLEKEPDKKNGKSSQTKTATEKLKKIRQMINEARAKAILEPTEQHLVEYITLQNYIVEKASDFTNVWQKVLLSNPQLDYAIQHPSQDKARAVVYSVQSEKEQQAIKQLSSEYGMFYFYRGKHPLDRELAESIKSFAAENQITLIPVSVDKTIIAIFKNDKASTVDNGQANNIGVKYFPALILVNPKTQQIKPLNYGFISQKELRSRFLQVATDFKKDFLGL